MKKNLLARLILSTVMVFSVVGFVPSALATHTPVHVLHVSGVSRIDSMFQYIPDTSVAPDELGIPKPLFGADGKPQAKPGAPACYLARNTNPVPGSAPPCAGNLSAADSFGLGCLDPMGTPVTCGLNAPTWFYGYCGQTYGGADGGLFTIGGSSYVIEKMGFTRGRGAWEFSGRMHKSGTTAKQYFRMHLAAVPDQPGQLAGCDVTKNISSVLFAGTLYVYGVGQAPPPKTFRTKPGWHWCADDAPFPGASTSEDC